MAIPPRILSLNFIYTTPKAEYFANHAKFVNTIIKDWQIGGFQNLQSGPFLGAPASPNAEFLPPLMSTTRAALVPEPENRTADQTPRLSTAIQPVDRCFAESGRLVVMSHQHHLRGQQRLFDPEELPRAAPAVSETRTSAATSD